MNRHYRYIAGSLLLFGFFSIFTISCATAASSSADDEQQCEKGTIYSVSKNGIVIDDRLFDLDGVSNFKDLDGESLNFAGFRAGDLVMYCITKDDGKLATVQHIGKTVLEQSKDEKREVVKPSQPANTIHLENGVWKN